MRYEEIQKDDIIIFGGGGFGWSNISRNNLKKVCEKYNFIWWGAGTHKFTVYDEIIKKYMQKAMLTGFRDYNQPGIPYLPCVTAKIPLFQKNYEIKNVYVLIEHKHQMNKAMAAHGFPTLTNYAPLSEIIELIGSCETVITSSFHVAYWGLLMNKKVLISNLWSDKFLGLKYQPEYLDKFDMESIETANNNANIYPHFLNEAIGQNDEYFEKVKELILNHDEKTKNLYTTNYQKVYESKMLALHTDAIDKLNISVKKLEQDIDKISKLKQIKADNELKKSETELINEIDELLTQGIIKNNEILYRINNIIESIIISIIDFTKYIDYLAEIKDYYLIIIASKDSTGKFLKDGLKILGCMDLNKKYRLGYVAVIDEGKLIFEKLSADKSDKNDFAAYKNIIDNCDVSVLSKGYDIGNIAEIIINGENYSLNKRGLNIAVYDKKTKKCIDSVSFDMCAAEKTCFRKKGNDI